MNLKKIRGYYRDKIRADTKYIRFLQGEATRAQSVLKKIGKISPKTKCSIRVVITGLGENRREKVEVVHKGSDPLPALKEAMTLCRDKFELVPDSLMPYMIALHLPRGVIYLETAAFQDEFADLYKALTLK